MRVSLSEVETIHFPSTDARLLRVSAGISADRIGTALDLTRPHPLLVVNGGTAKLGPTLEAQLGLLLQDGVARAAVDHRLTLVTGATDAGIFALLGQGLARWGRTAPCIGVTVADMATWPGKLAGEVPLEPHHSHFVLVEGQHWGDETTTMYALVAWLGCDRPSAAIFAGGGEIVIHEMQANVRQSRTMILLAGSGRATDAVLAARAGGPASDPRLAEIARRGTIIAFDIRQDAAALRDLLRSLL
jgi:TRPM family ion channel